MPIVGLTDSLKIQEINMGRSVRLGTLQKGEREGFGRKIKLYDRDYFVFKPYNGDEALAALFAEAYGEQPTVIPDVRIPVSLAGNFNIEDCAWLTAARHTERGSIFLARSDGRNIKQARDPKNGRKVNFHYDGEMPHDSHSGQDNDGRDCFSYNGKLYPWQRSFAIDLLLPEFNRHIFRQNVAGYGVVTLTTHSVNDIATLIEEYQAILDELVSLLSNPMLDDQDRVRRYLPLRNFPLRLYRSTDKVSTPDYRKNADPGERLISTRSLLHWQLAPDVSAAIQEAIDKRTAGLIEAVANAPMLTASASRTVDDINAELFDGGQPAALPEPVEYQAPDWDEIYDGDEDEVFEDPGKDPGPYDWADQAVAATNIDVFAAAVFQLLPVFADANKVRKAYEYMFGEFDPEHTGAAMTAMNAYANAVADGARKKQAIELARAKYAELVEWGEEEE